MRGYLGICWEGGRESLCVALGREEKEGGKLYSLPEEDPGKVLRGVKGGFEAEGGGEVPLPNKRRVVLQRKEEKRGKLHSQVKKGRGEGNVSHLERKRELPPSLSAHRRKRESPLLTSRNGGGRRKPNSSLARRAQKTLKSLQRMKEQHLLF